MKKHRLCVAMCLFVVLAAAQNYQRIDSLRKQLDSLPQLAGKEDDSTRMKIILELGYIYEEINNDTAIMWFDQIIDTAITPGNAGLSPRRAGLSAKAGLDKGVILFNAWETDKALYYYNWSAGIFRKLDMKKFHSFAVYNTGLIFESLGNYREARSYYLQSLKIVEEINSERDIAHCYTGIGIVHTYQGEFDEAVECFRKSMKIYEKRNDRRMVATCFNNIGVVYLEQGSLDEASENLTLALKIREEEKDVVGMAECYCNIGLVHQEQGSFDKAKEYHLKSIKIYQELGRPQEVAESYINLGNVCQEKKELDSALVIYEKALNMLEAQGDIHNVSRCYNNMASAYDEGGNYDKAMEYYQKALDTKTEIGDLSGVAATYGNIAIMKISMADREKAGSKTYTGLLKEANKYQQKGYKIATDIGALETERLANEHFYHICKGLHDYKKAGEYALRMTDMENNEIMRNFSLMSEKEKESNFKMYEPDFMDFNSFALEWKAENPSITGRVYDNTIRNKGLLLKSSTAMRLAVFNSKDSALIRDFESWIELKREIANLYATEKEYRYRSLEEAESQADIIEAELVKRSQLFSDFEKMQKLKWEDIRDSLKEGEAAVEFIHFKWKGQHLTKFTDTVMYCALVIRTGYRYPEMVPLCTEKELLELTENFSGSGSGFVNKVYGKNNGGNTGLYRLVWAPMEKYLEGIKTIWLSPSGLLHKISFYAIATEKEILLCDRYDLQIMSSTGMLVSHQPYVPESELSVSLFGGIDFDTDSTLNRVWSKLEGTYTEICSIGDILRGNMLSPVSYSGKDASEEQFRETASQSNILHVSTHGFFFPELSENEEAVVSAPDNENVVFRGSKDCAGTRGLMKNPNPLMRSGLVFAGANRIWESAGKGTGSDGVLTAQEVIGIDMRKTGLLVLSACETGMGDIRGSEGVYGLQRAFKMAGVKYIIMSLWQVPDKETVEFMELFYRKLLKFKDVRRSFNETQKEMRKKYDPYYWAAFVLVE
ncbi:MAG: CHAT domain-containing protein [Bacteroidota bacterium]